MPKPPATVQDYLAALPEDRRKSLEAVRKVILKHLDKDYEEGILYNMIGYYVPHSVYPDGYHCDPSKPLGFAMLASQKGYMSLYLMCIYGSPEHRAWFEEAWAKTGKKLDMGKACLRFKSIDDLALDVLGEAIKRVPAKKYLENYLAILGQRKTPPRKAPAKKAVATRPAAKKPASRKPKTKA